MITIVSPNKVLTRVEDGIKTLLSLNDKDFEEVIRRLNHFRLEEISFFYSDDLCKNPRAKCQIGLEKTSDEEGRSILPRKYFGNGVCKINKLFPLLQNRIEHSNEHDAERIKKIMSTRDENGFKRWYSYQFECQPEFLDKVFEILSDKDVFERFLDFKNNQDFFSLREGQTTQRDYLIALGNIFGNIETNKRTLPNSAIGQDFYIPDLQKYYKRYLTMYDRFNMDRYTNPMYEFRYLNPYVSDFIDFVEVIRKEDEPEDWIINDELHKAVYDGMTDDMTLEQKAMHIYLKLLKCFVYDQGYFFRKKTQAGQYTASLKKEHLENLAPGSKVTCWDFARVFMKFINELDGDIEAVILSRGENKDHFSPAFYTNNVSVQLEAIDVISGANDLTKVRIGLPIQGINIISDRKGLIAKAIESEYPKIFGRQAQSIEQYIEQLKDIPKEDVPKDSKEYLIAFLETMKENGIVGNELLQVLHGHNKFGALGKVFKTARISRKIMENGIEKYIRMIALVDEDEVKADKNKARVYTIDTELLELDDYSIEEFNEKMRKKEFEFEHRCMRLPGIGDDEK